MKVANMLKNSFIDTENILLCNILTINRFSVLHLQFSTAINFHQNQPNRNNLIQHNLTILMNYIQHLNIDLNQFIWLIVNLDLNK